MATPLSPDRLLAALRGEGLTVHEYPGWRDRCRCHTGSHAAGGPTVRAWGPVNGTMVHITAGGLGSRTVEAYIRDIINADPVTPTKCQLVVAPSGEVWINSAGRCNHAGTVSSASMDALAGGRLSLSGSQNLRGHDIDGNTRTYGIENIAATSMNAAQRESSVRICAAISRAHGWDGRDAIGHGEASDQRSFSDPNLDMGAFRRDVMARVAGYPTVSRETSTPKESTVAGLDTIIYTSTEQERVDVAHGAERGAWMHDSYRSKTGLLRIELEAMKAANTALAAKLDALAGIVAALRDVPRETSGVDVAAITEDVAARIVARLAA